MTNGHRDYKKEKAWERQDHPERLKQRAERKRARRRLEKTGKVSPFDGKQVDHIKAIVSGGSNSNKNLRVVSAHTNLHKEALRKRNAK